MARQYAWTHSGKSRWACGRAGEVGEMTGTLGKMATVIPSLQLAFLVYNKTMVGL
jgi:hypothetical protein